MRSKLLPRQAWDLETTGLILHGPRAAKPFSYSIFDGTGEATIERLDVGNKRKADSLFRERLSTEHPKVFHHLKYDFGVLKQNKYTINGPLHCTMIMNQLNDNLRRSDALDQIVSDLCGFRSRTDDAVYNAGQVSGNYQNIPHPLMHEYQIEDSLRGKLADDILWPPIANDPTLLDIYNYEIRLILVTVDMEANGIRLLTDECYDLISWLSREVHDIQQVAHDLTGSYINLGSDKQVSHLLYQQLGLPVLKYTDKAKQPAVDKETLGDLKEHCTEHGWNSKIDPCEMINLILKYKSYRRGNTTINKYIEFSELDNGIIHTSFNTNFDVTGRQASSKPNMHNVSKEKALANPYPIPARRCFGPLRDWFWDLYDYAQIELRLIVLLCGNEEMLSLYKEDPLFDIHTLLGCMWFDCTKKNFTKEMRDASKNTNFALPFGSSLETAARTLVLPPEVVAPRYDAVIKRFPEYAGWAKTMTKQAKRDGYVTTLFGRRLNVPHNAPHSGADYPIQGTAAEILKRGEVRVGEWLQNSEWGEWCKMISNVHDELIFQKHKRLHKKGGDEVHAKICEFMLDMPEIGIPMVVERERTYTRWSDAKEYGEPMTMEMLHAA